MITTRTTPSRVRITPVRRLRSRGSARVAILAASWAQRRVKTTHRTNRSGRGREPRAKWLTAPVRAEKVMTKTLVPTAVLSS